MKNDINIRGLLHKDLPSVKSIINLNQMFPSELLDDMTQGYFEAASSETWLVIEDQNLRVLGVVYCAPERMTEGTWNLLLIAVLPEAQGKGLGTALVSLLETLLLQKRVRILLVETSGLPEYDRTRKFYPKCGFKQVAVIPEHYAPGDDKVVFWKKLPFTIC